MLVEEDALYRLDLTVGAELYVPLSRAPGAPRAKVKVVGAFRRTDPGDPYWFLTAPLDRQFFLPETVFLEEILAHPQAAPGQYSWYYGVDSRDIRVSDAIRLLGALYDLEVRVAQGLPDTELLSGPMDLLTRYAYRSIELQLMLLLLAVPAFVAGGYFLMVSSGLMVDRQRQEIAVLRSRGASYWQIAGIYLAEGVLLGGLALAGGYPLGILLARGMGLVAGFLQFVDRRQPPLLLPAEFWTYGLGAAALALAAYMVPALTAGSQSIVSYKQEAARLGRRPLWSRFGLDLLLLGLAGYAYYVLATRPMAAESAVAPGGGRLTEPLQLIAPALFLLGSGLVLMRLLLPMAGLMARLCDRWAGPVLHLPLIRLSRAPGSYTPVVFLLTLTVGTGLYSATAARTLERNLADRVRYAGGADVVLEEVWEYTPAGGQVEYIPPPWLLHYDLPGVVHPARVRRQAVTPSAGGRDLRRGTLMAIDPVDFARVAWFRRDLAAAPLGAYLGLLAQDEAAVLVNRAFLERNRLRPGDGITLKDDRGQEVSLVIAAAVDYWPALNPELEDFFVANLDYVDYLQERSVLTIAATDHRQRLISVRRDPQVHGLLGGLTAGFLLAAGITVLGFLWFATLSAQRRTLEFGVLRAIGLTAPQVAAAVALEQVLVVGTGVAAGTGLGLAAARLFVPFLQYGLDRAARIPPFRIVTDPADPARLYLVLALMLLGGVAGLAAALRRLRIHEAIRLGEDH